MLLLDWWRALISPPLAVGQLAPDFTLHDDSGTAVSLSALRGRPVLLVFYPGDDTPVCRKQLCELRDHWSEARAAGLAVYGINPATPESHADFRQKFALPFPLLVDRGRRVAALYRANAPVVRRTVYLIGEDGCILLAERGTPSPAAVLDRLEGR